jgi:ERCC4-type nuclease
MLTETYGSDVMWMTAAGWVGIQRKELKDLIASVRDGRLGMQLSQMQRLSVAVLLVEGKPRFTIDGEMLVDSWGNDASFTKKHYRGVLWSARAAGVHIDFTETLTETIEYCTWFENWSLKERHSGLRHRPGPDTSWGTPGHRDYAVHVVSGLPGVGTELAGRVVDQFGIPFGWKITKEELMTVKGIGQKKADQMWKAIEGEEQ